MKKVFSLIVALTMVLMTMTTAFALDAGTEDAILTSLSPEEMALLNEENLIATKTIHYFVDDEGNLVDVVVGDVLVPYSNSSSFHTEYMTATFYFYKVGEKYNVQMKASSDKAGFWFTKHTMKIRPKNNTKWMTHTTPYETKPESISDIMAFTYPNGAPSNVSVEVETSFTLRGEGALAFTYVFPYTVILDDPDE